MAFAELNLAPRTRGRGISPTKVEVIGDLTTADLALLASERGIKPVPIKALRDRHHALARCLATGMSNAEASIMTGYDPSRISVLKADTTFKALVEDYRSMGDAAQADFVERTNVLTLTTVNRLQELVEDDDSLSPSTLLEIAKFSADRTGHAPVQRNVNLNVNADLGNRLQAARRRLALAQGSQVLEAKVIRDPRALPDITLDLPDV